MEVLGFFSVCVNPCLSSSKLQRRVLPPKIEVGTSISSTFLSGATAERILLMNSSSKTMRLAMVAAYVLLTLPCLTFIGLSTPGLFFLWFLDTFIRSIPLLIAHGYDVALVDGGELDQQLMPLWIVLTGVLLWPLITLGARPALLKLRAWRVGLIGYASVAIVFSAAASAWLFTHPVFF